MHYELVSRALAYVSCLSTLSLFLTSMAIAVINVGKPSASACAAVACLTGKPAVARSDAAGGAKRPAHVMEVADALIRSKI